MSENGATDKPSKQRSPRYPIIDLETALDRAQQLYNRERMSWAPIPAIHEAWGYSPSSSGGFQTLAALKRYGLLEDRGTGSSREARVTEFARLIFTDNRDDQTERMERIKLAALTPSIHKEIWDAYEGELPSDSTLRFNLVNSRGFSEGGADEFIPQFRKTIKFAQLTKSSGSLSPKHEETTQTQKPVPASNQHRGTPPQVPAIEWTQMPLSATAPPPIQFPVLGATVTIQTSAPLTEAAFEQMMVVLNALKPAIVTADRHDLSAETEIVETDDEE